MPNRSPIVWCPRHTPSTGTRPANASITSPLTPASRGVQGPGDTITWLGPSATASSTVIRSFRTTCRSNEASNSPIRCTRL